MVRLSPSESVPSLGSGKTAEMSVASGTAKDDAGRTVMKQQVPIWLCLWGNELVLRAVE